MFWHFSCYQYTELCAGGEELFAHSKRFSFRALEIRSSDNVWEREFMPFDSPAELPKEFTTDSQPGPCDCNKGRNFLCSSKRSRCLPWEWFLWWPRFCSRSQQRALLFQVLFKLFLLSLASIAQALVHNSLPAVGFRGLINSKKGEKNKWLWCQYVFIINNYTSR